MIRNYLYIMAAMTDAPTMTNAPATSTDDIHILVDRSGSMEHILTPTVSGLNEFMGSQKHLPGAENTFVTLHTFDDQYETPIPRTPLAEVPTITVWHIAPRGMTALYDAIGHMFADMPMTPAKVVIVTDGEENASKQFTKRQVMDQITERRRLGWTFIFLAANQDAIASGMSIGIPREAACTFNTTEGEVESVFRGASNVMTRARTDNAPAEFTQLERESSANTHLDEDSDTVSMLPPPAMMRTYSIPSRGATGY